MRLPGSGSAGLQSQEKNPQFIKAFLNAVKRRQTRFSAIKATSMMDAVRQYRTVLTNRIDLDPIIGGYLKMQKIDRNPLVNPASQAAPIRAPIRRRRCPSTTTT